MLGIVVGVVAAGAEGTAVQLGQATYLRAFLGQQVSEPIGWRCLLFALRVLPSVQVVVLLSSRVLVGGVVFEVVVAVVVAGVGVLVVSLVRATRSRVFLERQEPARTGCGCLLFALKVLPLLLVVGLAVLVVT